MKKQGRKSESLGLALGGGAARSLTHIGVLQVLVAANIPVKAIAGASGGAVIGAAYAAGAALDRLEREARHLTWRGMTRLAFSRRGLLGLDGLGALLRRLVPARRFEELSIPLRVIATELDTGERVVVSDGDLISALLASCAIPGVFLPVEREGKLLVDGGVSCNVPADVVGEMGAKVVMAVDATAGIQRLGQPFNLFQVMAQSIYAMSRQLTRHYLSYADLVVAPPMKGIGWEDILRAPQIIDEGRRQMRLDLPELTRLLRPSGLGEILRDRLRVARPARS